MSDRYYHLDRYQEESWETAVYPNKGNNLYYPSLGLAGEVGEVCNKIKKIMRDQHGVPTKDQKYDIARELGDVLWYVSALLTELDSHMACVAADNMEKVRDRKKRGVIGGSGDDR